MTTAQWFMEYHALQMKEEQQADLTKTIFEAAGRLLKNTLVMLLGLKPIKYAGEDFDDDSSIVPLSLMCGNPHVMQHIMQTAEDEAKVGAAAEDDDFDRLSEQIMLAAQGQLDDDGDMAPLFAEPLEAAPLDRNMDYQQMLTTLGIRPRTTPEEALHVQRRPGVLLDD